MLDDRDSYARARAIHLLGCIGAASAEVLAGIRRALDDPESRVRERAASVLAILEAAEVGPGF
jgi:HEAT repeat protein